MAVVVVIPSRGRPERAWTAVDALRMSAIRVDTSIVLAVDADDPKLQEYRNLRWPNPIHGPEVALCVLEPEATGNLVRATNTVSLRIAADDQDATIGNLGDDHVCRTFGWDKMVTDALEEPGIAYGDDLIHGEHLPSAPFISAVIVNALGWYALPTCRHLFIDDAWRILGRSARCLRYIPQMVIEHMHPAVAKAEWDAGYERANNQAAMLHDQQAYQTWRLTWLPADIQNVRAALNVEHGNRARYPVRVE